MLHRINTTLNNFFGQIKEPARKARRPNAGAKHKEEKTCTKIITKRNDFCRVDKKTEKRKNCKKAKQTKN